MISKVFPIGIYLLLTVIAVTAAFGNGAAPSAAMGAGLTLTGTVTARDGSTFTLRTDDGKLYTIDAEKSVVTLDRLPEGCISFGVGNRVRVYGTETSPLHINASRLHIFPGEPAASGYVPPATGSGPVTTKPVAPGTEVDGDARIPAVGDSLGAWRNRGLVTSVQYGQKMVTIATSGGPMTIDASAATVVAANSSISLARVSQGDAVRVWGEEVGLNKIRADRIEVLRGRAAQDSAVPVKNVSVVGRINSIDYPSFTFRIQTEEGDVNVMVDEGAFIHSQGNRKAFMNLAVGQMVKVEGFGNLASGYVASYIQIVGDPGS